MLINRATIRRQLAGEPPEDLGSPEARAGALDELGASDAIPAGPGLPPNETRAIEGRSSPLSQQARTGRASLLGDR
jgi:hypothetical protein